MTRRRANSSTTASMSVWPAAPTWPIFAGGSGSTRCCAASTSLYFSVPTPGSRNSGAGLGPAPLHLAGSFLAAKFLGWGDKLRVAFGLACLASDNDGCTDEPFAEWLLRHRQSLRSINLFWAPVLVSALNERLEQMDFGHARKVFLDGFLRNRTGFQPEIPLVPLGELYGTRLERWLRDHDVAVRLTTGVREVTLDGDGAVRGLILRSGEEIAADFVVVAVPFDRVGSIIPESIRDRLPALASLAKMRASPITGIHLWFDRPVCPFDHVVTPGRLIQWVFNHTAIQGRTAPAAVAPDGMPTLEQGQYVQVVISASYDLLALDKLAIRDAVLADLAEIWPSSRAATLLRWWVVTEHGATFAVRPGVEAIRPPQRTPVDGLFLAGDWTDTGWPATMEGAVRSGYLAAQGIMSVLDQPIRFLRPDLKPGWLARWLFGTSDLHTSRAFVPDVAFTSQFDRETAARRRPPRPVLFLLKVIDQDDSTSKHLETWTRQGRGAHYIEELQCDRG